MSGRNAQRRNSRSVMQPAVSNHTWVSCQIFGSGWWELSLMSYSGILDFVVRAYLLTTGRYTMAVGFNIFVMRRTTNDPRGSPMNTKSTNWYEILTTTAKVGKPRCLSLMKNYLYCVLSLKVVCKFVQNVYFWYTKYFLVYEQMNIHRYSWHNAFILSDSKRSLKSCNYPSSELPWTKVVAFLVNSGHECSKLFIFAKSCQILSFLK